jgi:hypothetical protein
MQFLLGGFSFPLNSFDIWKKQPKLSVNLSSKFKLSMSTEYMTSKHTITFSYELGLGLGLVLGLGLGMEVLTINIIQDWDWLYVLLITKKEWDGKKVLRLRQKITQLDFSKYSGGRLMRSLWARK